ncbi:MAG: NUDIX domain-containing protein, partial [Anaeroplasmataceae bacterium]|nr:NUDIX domain-containing protein [Anaeroplasmataceae bacterium]
PKVILCDDEFKNNLICTYRSLDYLQNLYKGDELFFIMGSDNLLHFDTWKRYEYILDTYNLFIIARKDIDISGILEKYRGHKGKIEFVDLEVEGFNSSYIRECISKKDYTSVTQFLDSNVLHYIEDRKLYTKEYQEYRFQSYTSDEEFLKNYSSDDYEKMSITTDIALFSVSDIESLNYRKKSEKSFSILLVERKTAPFMNRYCIPGGFLSLDEKLLDSAKRILFTEANIEDVYLKQFHTFSDIERDIRGRVLSVSFLGLIDKNTIINDLKPQASFYDLTFEQKEDILHIRFKNEFKEFCCKVRRMVDSYGIVSFMEIENEYLAFDHLKIIATALENLKEQIQNQDILYHMLPKEFTLKELQMVYETILGKKLIDSVFRRTIKEKVLPTERFKNDGGHRPSRLYSFYTK